jgi:hypothetical protein
MFFAFHSTTGQATPYPYDISGDRNETPSPEYVLLWALQTVLNADIEMIDAVLAHLDDPEAAESLGLSEEEKAEAKVAQASIRERAQAELRPVTARIAEIVEEAKKKELDIHAEL